MIINIFTLSNIGVKAEKTEKGMLGLCMVKTIQILALGGTILIIGLKQQQEQQNPVDLPFPNMNLEYTLQSLLHPCL